MTKPPLDRRLAPLALGVQAAKALGHPTRLRLLAMLRPGPLCVCQLTAVLTQATSTVSGHLLELRRAGLVVEEKRGKWVEYRLHPSGPFTRWLTTTLDLLRQDPLIARDAQLVRGVSRVPLDVLCRAKLDLRKAGIRPRADRAGSPAPKPLHQP